MIYLISGAVPSLAPTACDCSRGVVQCSVTAVWMGNVEPISWEDRSWNCMLGHTIKSHSPLSANQTSCCLVGQTLNRFFFQPYTVGTLPVWHVNCYKKIAEFWLLADCLKILLNTCQKEMFIMLYYRKPVKRLLLLWYTTGFCCCSRSDWGRTRPDSCFSGESKRTSWMSWA